MDGTNLMMTSGNPRGDVRVGTDRLDAGRHQIQRTTVLIVLIGCAFMACTHAGAQDVAADDEAERYTVSGTVIAEAREPSLDDNGVLSPRFALPVLEHPVRQATLVAYQTSDNKVVGRGHTNDDGSFEITVEIVEPVEVAVVVLADSHSDRYELTVEDCPMDNCPGGPNVYAYALASSVIDANVALGEVRVPITSEASGAFNILRVLQQGFDFVFDNVGVASPQLTAQWRAHSNTSCGTSCYGGSGTIYLLGLDDDSDEFDHDIILHEFGHFFEVTFSRSGNGGGFHDGSPTSPGLAWSEGVCTWMGTAIPDDPLYLDTNFSGGGWYDYSGVDALADPNAPLNQLMSEDMVVEVLFGLSNGFGDFEGFGLGAVVDVLSGYFPSSDMSDRGHPGPELVDFLDGWFCRGHGEREVVEELVNELHAFPYDFAGPDSCSAGGTFPGSVAEHGEPAHSPITPSRISFSTVSSTPDAVVINAAITGRSALTSAVFHLFVPEGVSVAEPTTVDLGALGPNATRNLQFTLSGELSAEDYVSGRLDTTLGRGSAYVMTSSHRPTGSNAPHTYEPDSSVTATPSFMPSLRVY